MLQSYIELDFFTLHFIQFNCILEFPFRGILLDYRMKKQRRKEKYKHCSQKRLTTIYLP